MVQACSNPLAVGAYDHGRVRMADLRGNIQRQRAEHEQVGGEGVACLEGGGRKRTPLALMMRFQ